MSAWSCGVIRLSACLALVALVVPASLYSQEFVELPANFVEAHVSAPIAGEVLYGQVDDGGLLRAARWSRGENAVTILNPAGTVSDIVTCTSADGQVAFGYAGSGDAQRAFRYVHAPGGGEVTLLDYSGSIGTPGISLATCCSLDGAVAYGDVQISNRRYTFRWTEGLPTGVGLLEEIDQSSYSSQCSDDGRIMVGEKHYSNPYTYIYSVDGGVTDFGAQSFGVRLSRSGNAALSYRIGPAYYYWRPANAEQTILPGNGRAVAPFFLSVDGAVVVGCTEFGRAFWWSNSTGTRDLGAFIENGDAYPTGISQRGRIIVGNAESPGGSEAFAALLGPNSQYALHSLRTLAIDATSDPDLTGWRFDEPTCISRNGKRYFIEGEKSGVDRIAYLDLANLPSIDIDENASPTFTVSDVKEAEVVRVELGQTSTLNFRALDADGDPMTVSANGLRSSFVLNPGSGSPAPAGDTKLTIKPGTLDVGTHDLSVSFSDGVGGVATRSFKIFVPQNEPPTLTPIAATTVECKGDMNSVTLATTVSDANTTQPLTVRWKVGGAVRETDAGLLSGQTASFTFNFPHGATTVDVEVVDGFAAEPGKTSTTVTVQDTTAPTVTLVSNDAIPTETGKNFALATRLTKPTVFDQCDGDPDLYYFGPSELPVGRTKVDWTAVDAEGLVTSVPQTVTVVDEEAPVLIGALPPVRQFVDAGEVFSSFDFPSPTFADNVSPADKLVVVSTERRFYPLGDTTVQWTARDEAGNETSVLRSIQVRNRPPKLVVAKNVVVQTKSERAIVRLNAAKSSDPDKHDLKFVWTSRYIKGAQRKKPVASGRFPLGKHRVLLKVTDEAGSVRLAIVKVTVKSKNGRRRPRGAQANEFFARASVSAREGVASTGGAKAFEGYAFAAAAEGLGLAAGEAVLWNECESPDQALTEYAAMRNLQRLYGRRAAEAFLASFAETGDPNALQALIDSAIGAECAQADLWDR